MQSRESFEQLVGERVGDYVIDTFLGVGGQAAVYRAHNQQTQGKSALKIFGLTDSTHGKLSAGLNEAKKQALVDHPAVVKVFNPGIDDVDFNGQLRQVLFLPMAYSPLGNCEEKYL